MDVKYIGVFLFLLITSIACTSQSGNDRKDDKLLVRVYNKPLYLSEMDGMFPESASTNDSLLIINAFVENWIRDALMLYEAERNIPLDLNIDKLVRDYRASLIRHNYENIIVSESLDSTVTEEQLLGFYENNKEQYELQTPIIRCHFIKVPMPVENSEQLRKWWNGRTLEDLTNLVNYSNQYATAHILEDSTWYKVEDIAAEFPNETITTGNIRANRDYSVRDQDFQYYFRVFEIKNQKEIAPLSFIEEQARKVILRKRITTLLQEKNEELYEGALKNNDIQIFIE